MIFIWGVVACLIYGSIFYLTIVPWFDGHLFSTGSTRSLRGRDYESFGITPTMPNRVAYWCFYPLVRIHFALFDEEYFIDDREYSM